MVSYKFLELVFICKLFMKHDEFISKVFIIMMKREIFIIPMQQLFGVYTV